MEEYLIEIDKENYNYLIKKDPKDRVNFERDGLYRKIKGMRVNDECIMNEDKCTIKEIEEGSFIITRKGDEERVSIFDINSLVTIPHKYDKSHRHEDASSNALLIKSKELGITIINPNCINRIESFNDAKDIERIIVFKDSKLTAILKWKGVVNDIVSIGCESGMAFELGNDGIFKNQNLFDCDQKKGIFIPLEIDNDAKHQICERENCQRHNSLNTNKYIIYEDIICCIKVMIMDDSFKDKNIIIKNGIRGKYRWKGLVNGEECIGVEIDQDLRVNGYSYDGLIKRINLFKFSSLKGALFMLKDIVKIIKCDSIDMDVINNICIKMIKPLEKFSSFAVVRKNNVINLLEIKGTVNVDSKECIECILPFYFQYGTAGNFVGHNLFECEDNKGVLIPKESYNNNCFADPPKHMEIKLSQFNYIEEECICCIRTMANIREEVAVDINTTKIIGKSIWTGIINGQNTNGIEMDIKGHFGSNGTFCGLKLFDCRKDQGYIFLSKDVKSVPKIFYVNDVYLTNDFSLRDIEKFKSTNFEDKLVFVDNEPIIYGRVKFEMKPYDEFLTAIEVAYDDVKKSLNEVNDIIFSKDIEEEGSLIIVRRKYVKLFNEKLRYFGKNNIFIDEKSVKIKEKCKYKENRKADIVTYENEYEKCYGKIVRVELLNGICCCYVINSIKIKEDSGNGGYIREEILFKVNDSISYLEDTIILPHSVVAFETIKYENFSNGENVEFRLRKSLERFEGILLLTVLVNNVPSAIIDLTSIPSIINITKYTINELKPFKYLPNLKNESVIVPINTVQKAHKKIQYCIENDVLVIDPLYVKNIDTSSTECKNISFKFKGKFIVATLKCIGKMNEENIMGCEMRNKSLYGTDGKFGDQTLFHCEEGKGVLILLENVEQCCVNGEHNTIIYTRSRKIIDSSICCFYKLKSLKKKSELKLNERVAMSNDNIALIGTCKWVGLVNDQEVIGVEIELCNVDDNYEYLDRLALFDFPSRTIGLFLASDLSLDIPCKNKIIPQNILKFDEIVINSSVIYYRPVRDTHINLYGTIKWMGMNEGEYYYGIELDDTYKGGTDGQFKGKRLFKCQNGCGFLAPVTLVAPDTRFRDINFTDEDVYKSEVCEVIQYSIPVKTARGDNCGIQGNANSCYFDSTIFGLFCKSDVLDFMISPIINDKEENNITKKFREVLSWKIVYPLRKYGFVSFHQTKAMREIITDYGGKFEEMTKHESDMENVAALLKMLCSNNQLIKLRAFNGFTNKAMFLQLFFILEKRRTHLSSQQMLDMSMAQNDIMFDEPPTCLIMQAPRDARGINCYENVFPSKTIEISNLCCSYYKKCIKCLSNATFQCKTCIEIFLRTKDGLFCNEHKCNHREVSEFPNQFIKSNSKVIMKLKTIICIEKAHFVTFVKEDEFKNKWIFFDSMSTQNFINNYAVPKVSFDKNISNFLNQDEDVMSAEINSYSDHSLKRIIKDSYIFVYHNDALTCY